MRPGSDTPLADLDKPRYSSETIRQEVDQDRVALFADWSVGRPPGWKPDIRTHDLICVGKWLDVQLRLICANDQDRRTQLWYYNRWSRSADNLFDLAADVLNMVLDGDVQQNRIPHRRWG